MKVGFLSIGRKYVDEREANILLFDNGHTADCFVTVQQEGIEDTLTMLRACCDAIVIEGNVTDFYDMYKDTLSSRPDHFELDGKLHSVVRAATAEFMSDTFIPLANKHGKSKRFAVTVFKTYGKSQEELKLILKDYMGKKSKLKLGFFPDFMECEVHARCSANIAQEEMSDMLRKLSSLIGKYTYAFERIDIAECVAQLLHEQGLRLKVAESFTGGGIASALTALPGASDYFMEDIVAYSVGSKHSRLSVPLEVIAERGAVSGDTAYGMAMGLMHSGSCDIALATTGNAGPSAQNGEVGLCYISVGVTENNSIGVFKYVFDGDRQSNIRSGVKTALFLLYKTLMDNGMRIAQARAEAQAQAEAKAKAEAAARARAQEAEKGTQDR